MYSVPYSTSPRPTAVAISSAMYAGMPLSPAARSRGFPRIVARSQADEALHQPRGRRLLHPGLGLDRRRRHVRPGDRAVGAEREPDLERAVGGVDLLEQGGANRLAVLPLAEIELHVRIGRGEVARLPDRRQILLADADGADEVLRGAREALPEEVGVLHQHHLRRGVGGGAERRGDQGQLDDGHEAVLAERPGSTARAVEYRTMR